MALVADVHPDELPDHFPEAKPCPLCGSRNLLVGIMSSCTYGVGCCDCGCNLRREYPEYYPDFLPRGDGLEILDKYVLTVALVAWNRRPE